MARVTDEEADMHGEDTRVTLGTTDVEIPPLGIGTWAWGDRFVWGYQGDYTDEDVRAAFDAALEAGVTFFDTAEVYGLGTSERLLGRFIRERDASVTVATKMFPFPWRLGQGALHRALRKSLDRLGLERVDLYQMHWPTPLVPVTTWMDAMADAVDQGLVRAVGVSNYDMEQMGQAHNALTERGVPLASNQVHYSLLHRTPERNGVLKLCRDLSVTLIAYSPLEMGILTGKYTPETPPSGSRRFRYGRDELARVQPLLARMREIGAAHADADGPKSEAQVALNWTVCKGTVPIPGAKNARHARSNAGALGWRLTDDEVAELDERSAEVAFG
jgi:aryl-alcohol dehydrogenase-like predicted oxidoreductase